MGSQGRAVSSDTGKTGGEGLRAQASCGAREPTARRSSRPGAWRGGRAARCALAPEGIPAAGGPSDTTARTAFRAAWGHSERPAHRWFCGRIPEPNGHLSLGKKWDTENAGPQTRSRTLSAAPRRLRRELTSRPRVGAGGSARGFYLWSRPPLTPQSPSRPQSGPAPPASAPPRRRLPWRPGGFPRAWAPRSGGRPPRPSPRSLSGRQRGSDSSPA